MKRRGWLLIMTIAAMALGAAACSGSDDDDDTASPTPYDPDICYIIWARPVAGGYDAYVWQAGAGVVASNGANTYDFNTTAFDSVLGFFYYRTDASFENYTRLGVTTAGTFTFTAAGILEGDAWTFEDTSNQIYYELPFSGPLLGQIASNGIGAFTGDLSEPQGTVSPGTGTLTIAYLSSTIVMNAQYAVCEEDSTAFTGANRPSPAVLESASRVLRRMQ